VALTNGSTTATISDNAPDDLILEAEGKKYLIVKEIAGPIAVSVNRISGARRGLASNTRLLYVSGGASSILASYFTTRNTRYSPASYVVATLVPTAKDSEDLRIPIAGWLSYTTSGGSGNQSSAFFLPGSAKINSGFETALGSYKLFIDRSVEISSINNKTLTLADAWTDTTGSYSFNVTGGLKNDIADVQDTLLTTYGGVQTQFRAGTRDQTPFTGQGGEGSTAISNTPSAGGAIEWTTGYSDDQGSGAQAPKELIGGAASGFNLTASQLREIDEARITWQYPSLYAMDGGGEEKHTAAKYLVELAIKRPGESDYDASFILYDNLSHKAKSKNALSFNIVVDMAQYQPLSDFKFIVSRKTDHQNDGYDQNGIRKKDWSNQTLASLSSTTAIIKEKLSHPYSAMAKVSFSSKEFQNMPKRSYHLRGAMVRVPSNYVTREENGTNQAVYTRDSNGVVQNDYQDWDGSFRDTLVYTNNPAWVFYDILVNNRYGLGDFLSKSDIDIYQLYRIGRYCDELVLDGKGGYEPRFTSNIFLTKQADAFKILKDMMTTFRSLLYFIDGQITAIQDAPSGPVYNFSKSNVIDGSFYYEGTGSKTRVNQVVVSWNNPDNNYKLEPLLVEDRANIAKTGKIISQDAAAFGCASQGQALRYGRWKLWTAANQTELVKFATGLNGAYLFPGDVVNVQDADKNNVRYSGRLSNNMEKGLTLSQTFPAGIIAEQATGLANADYSDPVVMACDVVLPATFSQNECLFEKGGTGRGMFVGVLENSGAPQLVYRFSKGDAATQATSTLAICEKVAISTIPEFDGGSHTVTWEAYPTAPGRGRLWIDGRLIIDATTTDASGVESNNWGGANLGGYGLQGAAIAGEYASVQPWSGVLQSSLRVYNDQQISYTNNTVNLDSPVTLNANSTYKLSVVFIEPSAFLAQESATINSVDYVRGDLIKRAYIDSNGDGSYTFQLINSEADSVNAKATQTGTDALLLTWSDYTTVEQRTVSTSAGSNIKALTVSEAFTGAVTKSHIWVLEETDNSGATVASSAQPYKILSVTESDKNTYEIIAVAHYDEKFSAIETDFTTYIADPVLPRITSTDAVPKVSNFYSTISASSEQAGQTVQLFWAPPATLATTITVAESDAPATGNTQTTLDGGASNYYEFLSGYELHHDLPGTPSPMRFGKDARSASFSGVPEGSINFALRTINTLDNKSKPTLITTTGVGKYSAKGQRYPYGVLVGGTIDVGSFVDLSGLYQFEDYAYTMKPGGNALTITNNSSTAALWQQDCSDLPVITFTPGDGNVFESSLYYILLDSSDSSDRLKLVKLYNDTTHGVQYWYDAGTGNATDRWGSDLSGTISKAAGASVMTGSGTSFTTELQVGDLVSGGGGNDPLVLGRVVSIQSNTLLELDKAHANFSISNASIKIPNIRIDTVNDVIISSIHKDSGGFVHTPLNTINTSIKTVIESDDSALAYYWPSNSVNGDYITETVAGAHGEVVGTAPTVSTQSPVGNSLVNDDGMLLLSDTQADALESGGFSASYWFKSTSSGGNAFARLLTRDQNNNWAMGLKQDEAADDVQNLIIWVNGPSGATLGDAITLNKWHHAGIVYDGTNFKVFLDGEEVYNKTGYAPISANPRPIAFGVNVEEAPETQNKFIGQFTEIKFFNDPISNAQMRNLYRLPGSTVAGTSDTPIQLGGENGSVLKVTSEGLSLGNTTFASAPFRVDMAGNLNATSGTFSGSITGASGTFGGDLQIGSGESVFKADSNGIYLGNETFANAEFSVTPAGALKATSAEVTGELKVGSFAGGQPVLDTVENTAVARGAMTSPRISMRGGDVYYGTLEDGTTIYKNDEVVQLNKTKGTRNNFSTAIGDIIHSNKPVVLHAAQGSLPSLAQTGTEFATMTGSGTNQNYFYYSPYGDTTVRLLKNTSANPTKSAGGTLIDWSDHNEFDKVHAATALEAGYRYEIVTPGDTDFTAIGAADSNAGTQFNSTGAGTGTGTAKIVEGWISKAVPATTVTEHTVVTSNNIATYTWIKADAPIVIYRNSGGNDHTIVRPAAREIFTYDGYLENKFNPSDTTTSQNRQSETDWRYIRNATAKLGSFDNGDGSGGDGTSHFPWSFAGDTYCLPHTLSGYQIATIESAIINAYYWSGSAWTLYKSHDLSEASRENFLGLKEGFDSVGGTNLGTSTVWRFVGTGRFVLRTNSTGPLAVNDEYFALGYDSNLRAENTLRVGKIIAGDIAADAITADAIDVGAITADAIAVDSIAVNKLTGDISDVYNVNYLSSLGQLTAGETVDADLRLSLPPATGGVTKRADVSLTVKYSVTRTGTSTTPAIASMDVNIQRLSQGDTTGVSIGTITQATAIGSEYYRYKIVGNQLSKLASIGGVASSASPSSSNIYPIAGAVFTEAVTGFAGNFTYVFIKANSDVLGGLGQVLYFNRDSWTSQGLYIPSVNNQTIVMQCLGGDTISGETTLIESFGESSAGESFRVTASHIETLGQNAPRLTVHKVQGSMEYIA